MGFLNNGFGVTMLTNLAPAIIRAMSFIYIQTGHLMNLKFIPFQWCIQNKQSRLLVVLALPHILIR